MGVGACLAAIPWLSTGYPQGLSTGVVPSRVPCGCRKSAPRSCGERVFVDEAADAVVPADSEGVEVGDGRWYRLHGWRLVERSVRAVLVVMSLVLAENPQQMSLV